MSRIQNLIHNKVTRNAAWLIGGRVYHMLLAFVVGLLTARYLGPSKLWADQLCGNIHIIFCFFLHAWN